MANRLLALVIVVVLLVVSTGACSSGGKSSSVEGKLVDWNDKPVARVKITAAQVQPIKGYEQFEGVTSLDGTFKIKGLFPSSVYVLKPWPDKWSCETEVRVNSAPQGETALLPQPMKVAAAYTKDDGSQIFDLATGKAYFTAPATGLEWVVGPDRNTNYAQAEQWVAACKVAGGGWRMPTWIELSTLYQKRARWPHMDPAIKTTGAYVWAEPYDSSSAFYFDFVWGNDSTNNRDASGDLRVFGVRSRPR